MQINIIHLKGTDYSADRLFSFTKEMNEQGITDYKVWDGVHDSNKVRGISRAHKQIVQYAKDAELSEICIAEDDIIFTGKGAFEYYLQSKPSLFSIYMGGLSNIVSIMDDCILDFRGLTLYTVHRSFYNRFLSVPENINLDAGLKNLGLYRLCSKVVCSQKSGYSYHKKRYKDYSHLLKQYDTFNGEV